MNVQPLHDDVVPDEPAVVEPQGGVIRRSHRERRSVISNDYVVYLEESKIDLEINNDTISDPASLSKAMESADSAKWFNAIEDELKSMDQNQVWDLVDFPEGCKKV